MTDASTDASWRRLVQHIRVSRLLITVRGQMLVIDDVDLPSLGLAVRTSQS